MKVRPMKPSDRQAVAAIYLRDRELYFPWVAKPNLADFDHDSSGEALFVAEVNGQIAGFASLIRVLDFIHLLFVAPEFRHQGVGHALIARMRQEAIGSLTLKCVINNEAALKFYAGEGFAIRREDRIAVPANYTLIDVSDRVANEQ
ncbi:GNAT family acetyltransferase [Secundilactobacillus pentosiphilus]|uniref:GNAT family acetyltransferase n=1 Tax=Secundilactobacillus pentosiphilus TaxID=1714682 RepID=A0A1Z5IRZ6_9LACO|nr:GNAT family N-acetyltransferase [Secundilactobacillus pentosiphilus]GAX04446.1 GNAT family acetyltransferase [Secundilactobacillus pentosiphilus]